MADSFHLSLETIRTWKTIFFEPKFIDELCANQERLPLESMCQSGGLPKENSLRVKRILITKAAPEFVEGTLDISFFELIAAGCADVERLDNLHGEIFFTLNLQNGLLETNISELYFQTGE